MCGLRKTHQHKRLHKNTVRPIETRQPDNTHNVCTDVQKPLQEPPKPIDNTHNVLSGIFEKVKEDIQSKKLDNPSFKNLQSGYEVTQKQAKTIRDMLLDAKLAVKDKTGQLVPVL
ncbi:hypothetical protein BGP_3810 [Beggiatoa sp. PS]|nr:hypothetical protein BGP_3810 [Beggiatoa sp. PS]